MDTAHYPLPSIIAMLEQQLSLVQHSLEARAFEVSGIRIQPIGNPKEERQPGQPVRVIYGGLRPEEGGAAIQASERIDCHVEDSLPETLRVSLRAGLAMTKEARKTAPRAPWFLTLSGDSGWK